MTILIRVVFGLLIIALGYLLAIPRDPVGLHAHRSAARLQDAGDAADGAAPQAVPRHQARVLVVHRHHDRVRPEPLPRALRQLDSRSTSRYEDEGGQKTTLVPAIADWASWIPLLRSREAQPRRVRRVRPRGKGRGSLPRVRQVGAGPPDAGAEGRRSSRTKSCSDEKRFRAQLQKDAQAKGEVFDPSAPLPEIKLGQYEAMREQAAYYRGSMKVFEAGRASIMSTAPPLLAHTSSSWSSRARPRTAPSRSSRTSRPSAPTSRARTSSPSSSTGSGCRFAFADRWSRSSASRSASRSARSWATSAAGWTSSPSASSRSGRRSRSSSR